jgi:hypothetical protein
MMFLSLSVIVCKKSGPGKKRSFHQAASSARLVMLNRPTSRAGVTRKQQIDSVCQRSSRKPGSRSNSGLENARAGRR